MPVIVIIVMMVMLVMVVVVVVVWSCRRGTSCATERA